MASTLQFVSREELDEIEQELGRAAPRGESPDLDALQCQILVELIVAYRNDGVAPSYQEVIAAALDALEDNDNHAATVILKTAARGAEAPRKITSVAEFCAEAERIGLTVDVLAEALSKRPEFADCLPGNAGVAVVREQGIGDQAPMDIDALRKRIADLIYHPSTPSAFSLAYRDGFNRAIEEVFGLLDGDQAPMDTK